MLLSSGETLETGEISLIDFSKFSSRKQALSCILHDDSVLLILDLLKRSNGKRQT